MVVRSISTESYFSPESDERSHQLRGVAIYLRSSVPFSYDQSSGKQPKFNGNDALNVMMNTGLVETREQGEEVMGALEEERLIAASKGTVKSPRAENKRYRFTESMAVDGEFSVAGWRRGGGGVGSTAEDGLTNLFPSACPNNYCRDQPPGQRSRLGNGPLAFEENPAGVYLLG